MPTNKEVDAAFAVVQREARWGLGKVATVRKMLEAAEAIRAEETQKETMGFVEHLK